jgi:uncharacterized integral membrane protein
MKYLILSVLVVCVIGIMIPSTFAQVGPNYQPSFGWGWPLIMIFLIVVPVALVILVVIAIKIMRRKK